jgi:hypothetical protein
VAGELLAQIRECVSRSALSLSLHALAKAEERDITPHEIEEALLAEDAEMIEDYPRDPRGPSCLILGWTARGRPLHIQISYPPDLRVITAYEPDPERWIEHRVRR